MSEVDRPTLYITNVGPKVGPMMDAWKLVSAIGVIEEDTLNGLPCGMACRIRPDAQGRTLWALKVRGVVIPGHHAIVDRRFVLVDSDGEPPALWRVKVRVRETDARLAQTSQPTPEAFDDARAGRRPRY